MQNHIPNHVINDTNKRRQRKSYIKTIKRAGFNEESSGRHSLSCIEPENNATKAKTFSIDEDSPTDYHSNNANQKHQNEHRHENATSKNNTLIPWLGNASKSLIANLVSSSCLYDIYARPINGSRADVDTTVHQKRNVSGGKPVTNKMSERLLNLNKSIATAGPLGQHLFKTTVSDGFGKLVYPNGTVYIGMVRTRLQSSK